MAGGPLILLLAACTEYTLGPDGHEDVFVQAPSTTVDVLLVVDDSGSMAPHQARLADHFAQLADEWIRLEVGIGIGVTTTDRIAGEGRLHAWVDPRAPGAHEQFAEAVQVQTEGSGLEMGLASSLAALDHPENAGFLTEDAQLAVLYVSDEDDSSPAPVGTLVDGLRAAITAEARDAVRTHALVVTDVERCTQPDFVGARGDRYLHAAALTGGSVVDLCTEDLAAPLASLAREMAGVHRSFALSGWPVPGTLDVVVDGETTACGQGWSLTRDDRDVLWLVFDRTPPVGTTIQVRYERGLSATELVCS